jgi:hypothetical protein
MTFRKLLVALGMLLGASVASATVTYTFTADGVTDSIAQQGTAVFEFSDDATQLMITLTDNVDPTAFIASELDGLLFSFSQAPATLTLLSLAPVSVINCNGVAGTTCPTVAGDPPLYQWGTTLSGDDAALGAGFTGSGFAYHPYAIVNENYVAPGGNGGLSNDQHNPLLVGPVTFTFALTGLDSVPEITSVTFLFGTVPDSQNGASCTNGDCGTPDLSVPEPRTLTLLGLGLLTIAWYSRRMRRTVA